MTVWRVVLTDSESLSGVAPVCPGGGHRSDDDPFYHAVYDCCPGPHIECFSPAAAEHIAGHLSHADAEVCS
jgi:hypothetical protein